MSEQINITLPDGTQKPVPKGTKIADFVREQIGPGLAKAAVFARVNGEERDLTRPLDQDAKLEIFTSKSAEALEVIRHDAAHIVASVVQRLFPGPDDAAAAGGRRG